MPSVFLHLEVDTKGIKAKIIEPGFSQTIIKDECIVLYETLPESEGHGDPFDAGIEIVAQHMDLTLCSSAMIFISTSFVSFRTLQLPFGSEKKIRQVLPYELETLLPLSDESYISDFHVTESKDGGSRILSASVSRARVDQYFSTLERFNIKPLVITPTGYAIAVGFLKAQKESKNFVFVHMAKHLMTLVVVMNKIPCIVRSLPGGEKLSPDDLAQTIHQTLRGYSQRTGDSENFEFFICTDDENIETGPVYKAIENKLDYDPLFDTGNEFGAGNERIDPESFICSMSPDKTDKFLYNFCRGEYRTSTFFQTYFANIAASVVLLFCALSLMIASVSFDNARLEDQVEAVDQEAVKIFKYAFPNIKKVQDPYLEMQANVKAATKKDGSGNVTDSASSNLDVKIVNLMGELSKRIDPSLDMEISRFLFSKGRLVLSGSTDNFNNVDKIKGKLEVSKLFKKVEISSAASDNRENKVNFKFIIDI